MKLIKLLCIAAFLLCATTAPQAQTLKVATYNIKYDEVRDTVNAWKTRLPLLTGLIRYNDFDIFGTQEGLHHQLQDMTHEMPGYAYIGAGRDDGKQKGEFSAIFYKTDKFKLLKNGDFWLSETPDKPGKGWDAAYPRIGTWGQFQDKATGFTFYLFNMHFDNRGEQAREESAKLVLRKINELAGKSPVILTGDFNFSQDNPVYQLITSSALLKDAYQLADVKYAPSGTFNNFGAQHITNDRIDHIFLTSGFKVQRYGIHTDTYGKGKYPSDHFPVSVLISYKK
ncbi:endonuclease/exonuclease/phosphatase family protein [Botryobacter ruber]|uniref:endonuclease/exonuclease/phosphatase family protein n=1 Tax=Botryobacter ruber TaxID=2171629 RepID=UPI000E0ACC26|nr:endonuclease/exonuclease/phosphatase family protein [Botryobacter ruber]